MTPRSIRTARSRRLATPRAIAVALTAALLITAALPPSARAQGARGAVRTVALGAPAHVYAETFTTVTSVAEGTSGSLYVADAKDKLVKWLPRQGPARTIGRQGSGPGEYLRPARLWVMRGDTLVVSDGQNGRLVYFTGSGKAAGIFSAADMPQASALSRALTGNGVLGVDRLGRLYVTSRTLPPNLPSSGLVTDSLDVLRIDRAAKTVTPVTRMRGMPTRIAVTMNGKQVGSVNISINPLSVSEQALVGDDGQVIVARLDPYHLTFYPVNGAPRNGGTIRNADTPVNAAIKAAVLTRSAERNGTEDTRHADDVPDWPEQLPPFTSGSVRLDPVGRVWLERPATTQTATTYDVVDHSGRLVLVVSTDASVRVVGFTSSGVVTARIQDDGLQLVEIRPLP